MSLLAEVLLAAGEEMMLAVSKLLAKKKTIPRESATLEGEKKVVLSSGVLAVLTVLKYQF